MGAVSTTGPLEPHAHNILFFIDIPAYLQIHGPFLLNLSNQIFKLNMNVQFSTLQFPDGTKGKDVLITTSATARTKHLLSV